jgi:hypothetical protein
MARQMLPDSFSVNESGSRIELRQYICGMLLLLIVPGWQQWLAWLPFVAGEV